MSARVFRGRVGIFPDTPSVTAVMIDVCIVRVGLHATLRMANKLSTNNKQSRNTRCAPLSLSKSPARLVAGNIPGCSYLVSIFGYLATPVSLLERFAVIMEVSCPEKSVPSEPFM